MMKMPREHAYARTLGDCDECGKRGHVRVKISVPIELTPEGSETPLRD